MDLKEECLNALEIQREENRRLKDTCNAFAEAIEHLQERLQEKDELLGKVLTVNSNLTKRIMELEDEREKMLEL